MSQDKPDLKEREELLDKSYQYYRDQLTATLTPLLLFTVALLGAFLNQNPKYFNGIETKKAILFTLGFLPLIFAVIFTLSARLLIFYGYKAHANKNLAEYFVEKSKMEYRRSYEEHEELVKLKNTRDF